ncbi:MAG: serpin family protein [Segniliparus sp.]|uniref:serpin family protein n=1 Tax=Segniliparus sp. TaxID=2804064 RepID=UPI003F306C94
MRRRAVAVLAAALLAGCSSHPSSEAPHLVPLYSKLKLAEIGVDEYRDEVAGIAEKSRQLAVDLLESGRMADRDTVFSPWAKVRTGRIWAHADGSGDDPAAAAMIGQLGKWAGDPVSVPNGGVDRTPILRSQTVLVADRALDIAPEFLDLLAKDYDMGVYLARPGDPKLASAVNAWAMSTAKLRFSDSLQGLGVPRGVFSADVTVLLAGWQFPFRPEHTADAAFTTANGGRKSVPTMRAAAIAQTAAGPGWRAVQLPLADGIEMRVIVPDDPHASPAAFVPAARAALADAPPQLAGIALPRWSGQGENGWTSKPLEFQGLGRIAPEAGISGWADLAAISFGEQGVSTTSAPPPAAASAAVADPPPAISFAADRPFCFEIFDPGTGLVLLAGRVADPGR